MRCNAFQEKIASFEVSLAEARRELALFLEHGGTDSYHRLCQRIMELREERQRFLQEQYAPRIQDLRGPSWGYLGQSILSPAYAKITETGRVVWSGLHGIDQETYFPQLIHTFRGILKIKEGAAADNFRHLKIIEALQTGDCRLEVDTSFELHFDRLEKIHGTLQIAKGFSSRFPSLEEVERDLHINFPHDFPIEPKLQDWLSCFPKLRRVRNIVLGPAGTTRVRKVRNIIEKLRDDNMLTYEGLSSD